MKSFQKNQKYKIIAKWLCIFLWLILLFQCHQHFLSSSYVERVLSWIGQEEEWKNALFAPVEEGDVLRGIEYLRDAGYEATGKAVLIKEITSYGRMLYIVGVMLLCVSLACLELVASKKKQQAYALILHEKEKEIGECFRKDKDYLEMERAKMGKTMENLSHQLRTPIAGTMLSLEYLLDTETDTSKQTRLQECIGQVERMSDITQALLRLAQIDSGKIWMKKKRENLTKLTEDSIQHLQILALEKQIVVEDDIDENCILSCDAFWMKEALENVLKNAIAFSAEDSIIRITLKKSENLYDLRIFNSGKPLEENEKEKIFERFYQAEENIGAGFGIGLHLAREIARLHEGNLRILDTKESGTTFQFLFPVVIAKDAGSRSR